MSEGKKKLKKIKYKKPGHKPAGIVPPKENADTFDLDLDAFIAQDLKDFDLPAPAESKPTPAPQAAAPAEDDEFERLLNEFINAELDDVEADLDEARNAPAEKAPSASVANTAATAPAAAAAITEDAADRLAENEQSLYRAYLNYFYAINILCERVNARLLTPGITADDLYPHYKPKHGRRMTRDIIDGWDILLLAFPNEIMSLDPSGTDDELLNFAEKCSDEILQLAIISYVEILIEIEGCEIAYSERRLKAEKRKIERKIYEEHKARLERSRRYIKAIQDKHFPIDADRLVNNFFKTSNKDAEGAYKMLTTNPATFSPIEIGKIKPRFFGLIKVTPQDGIRANKEIGEFIKKLKA